MSEAHPISLSDDQLTQIMQCAEPLAPPDRSAFLEAVAVALRSHPVVGDGIVGRVVRQVQATFQRGVDTVSGTGVNKYWRTPRAR
jgi:hypothetical protein